MIEEADSQAPYVYRVVDGQAKRTPISTGLRRDAEVEVVDGLRAGDEVVTAGQMKLRDGAAVRPVGEGGAATPPAAAGPPGSSAAAPAGPGK